MTQKKHTCGNCGWGKRTWWTGHSRSFQRVLCLAEIGEEELCHGGGETFREGHNKELDTPECGPRKAYRVLRDEVRRLRGGLKTIRSGIVQRENVSDRRIARATLEGHTICLECGKDMDVKMWRDDIPEFHFCKECNEKEG